MMKDCLHIHVTRWRSAGSNDPVFMWSCSKCHAQFISVEMAAWQVERLGMEGYGTLAIAAAMRRGSCED